MEGDNPLTKSGMERLEKQKVIDDILESIHKGSLTKADLEKLSPASMYKRPIEQRIFVNRPLRLDTIDYFGFDMDYTLAIYTQEYEFLEYELAIEKLLQMGYPKSISELKYDPNYSIRGLFLDIETGNFLKIDNFGNISACVHGRVKIQKKNISEFYPSMRVHSDDIGKRFYLLNTLFTLPEACLYTDLVTHLEGLSQLKKSEDVTIEDISYANLFHDVRYAIDYVHTDNGPLKKKTLEDIGRYIVRTEKLSIFLHTLKQWKKQTFLLTNSPWYYTDKVMSYLLDGFNDQYASWMGYFDQVIVSAAKPAFFMKGTTLREVDKETGQLKIGHVTGKFQPGSVYQGGNMTLFEKLANVTSGDRVLYTGDHIFADIIISKKKHGWRTLLVVPELRKELQVWKQVQPIYQRLLKLEYIKSEIYRGLDYSAKSQPDTILIRKQMREALEELNNAYNTWFGSLFRSGLKLSFFGMQVQRYADLYTTDYYNILNYPMFYYYSPTPSLMQHEARHDDEHEMVF